MTNKYKLDRETLELLTNASQMLSYFGSTYKMIPINKLKAFDKDQIIGQDMEFTSWLNDLAEIGNKLLEAAPPADVEPTIVVHQVENHLYTCMVKDLADLPEGTKLYTHPPADKDAERLDYLQSLTKGYGCGWVLRESVQGRGMRLHETSDSRGVPSVREAIDKAMGEV